MSGLAVRIAAAALFVGALAVAIVVVGVLTVGEATFARLMISQGSTAADAQDMFDQSITSVVLVAAVAAVAAAIAGGVILAQRISRPVARVGAAARRLAQGEHGIRVPRQGPAELVSLADSFNQLAHELEQQERQRIELIENFAHELRTPLTNLLGYLHGMRDGVVSAKAYSRTAPKDAPYRTASLHREVTHGFGEDCRRWPHRSLPIPLQPTRA